MGSNLAGDNFFLFFMPFTIDTSGRNYQYVIILLTKTFKTSIHLIFGHREVQRVIGKPRKRSGKASCV